MNNPILIYRSLAFSVFIHVLFFMMAIIIIKQSDIHKKTEPYIVSLVEDMKSQAPSSIKGKEVQDISPKIAEPVKKQPVPIAPKIARDEKQEENIVKDRIAALEAKKKIERIVALRKVINVDSQKSVVGGKIQKPQNKLASSGTASTSASGADYYSMIVKRIREEWIFPESLDRNLEAIISIKITRDGTVKIDKIEKSSGNQLFDRYALRAINKASPLPPPPQEMEVGVRFYP